MTTPVGYMLLSTWGARGAIGLIGGLAVLAGTGAFLIPPIPQDPAYHRLADARSWLGIPNALNVLSNAGFVLVGALGLALPRRPPGRRPGPSASPGSGGPTPSSSPALLLTGLGSAYYHWAPGNPRLAWDRLPLAITLMGLLDAVIAERVGVRAALRLLGPLVALAAPLGRLLGADRAAGRRRPAPVRPRAVLSAGRHPAHDLAAAAALHRERRAAGRRGIYALAKLPELADAWILSATRVVSGHTLKHRAGRGGRLLGAPDAPAIDRRSGKTGTP